MQSILIIGSILGIINCLILIIYPIVTKKGGALSNFLFSAFVISLFLIISKPLFTPLSNGLHNLLFTTHLVGLIFLFPTYFLFIHLYTDNKKSIKVGDLIFLLPASILIGSWFIFESLQTNYKVWNLYHRIIMLVSIAFLAYSIFKTMHWKIDNIKAKKQFNIISSLLIAIWFACFLHEITGLRYIEETILLSFSIYLTIRIAYNKGFVIELTSDKYKKTGLKEAERSRILNQLKELITIEKVYRDNIISANKIAKRINTNVHSLSQVINESYQYSFFELIGSSRINEAKELLISQTDMKISDIAYHVGYNSLSAFNTAFKKQTNLTPTQFRNEKAV